MGVTNSTNGGGRNIFKMGRTANLLQKNVNMLQIVVHLYIVSGAATLVLSETSRVNAEMRVSDIRRILGVATTQGLAGLQSNEFPFSLASQMFQKQFLDKGLYIQTFLCSYDIILGVECEGIRLNLTQPCRGDCNINAADEYRNYDGVVRAFVPCNSTEGAVVDQCIPEANVNDGTFNCRNRWSMKNCLNPNTM